MPVTSLRCWRRRPCVGRPTPSLAAPTHAGRDTSILDAPAHSRPLHTTVGCEDPLPVATHYCRSCRPNAGHDTLSLPTSVYCRPRHSFVGRADPRQPRHITGSRADPVSVATYHLWPRWSSVSLAMLLAVPAHRRLRYSSSRRASLMLVATRLCQPRRPTPAATPLAWTRRLNTDRAPPPLVAPAPRRSRHITVTSPAHRRPRHTPLLAAPAIAGRDMTLLAVPTHAGHIILFLSCTC